MAYNRDQVQGGTNVQPPPAPPKPDGRPACAQVIVRYLPHLQQENNPYSICTEQISEAVQFIKANY